MINMNIANPRACLIGGRVVKQVEKLKYLGTLEFEERLRKANQAMGMLKTVWNNNNFSTH